MGEAQERRPKCQAGVAPFSRGSGDLREAVVCSSLWLLQDREEAGVGAAKLGGMGLPEV